MWDPLKVDVQKIDSLIGIAGLLQTMPLFFVRDGETQEIYVTKPADHWQSWARGDMTLNKPREANDIGDPAYMIPLAHFKKV